MEKSIESIWKDGFLNQNALVVPKLNNLYTQKSIHVIDKILRMGKINLIYIGLLALVFLVIPILIGEVYFGIALFLLVIPHLLLGLKHAKLMLKIDKSESSYQYIKSFDACIKHSIKEFILLSRFFYPLLFLTFVIQGRFTESGERILNFIISRNSEISLVFGAPVFLVIIVMVITVLLAICGGLLYKLDLNIVYGRVLKKLKEIITDMEELRQ